MTESDPLNAAPFWQRKTLEEMTQVEWESLCDGCGRCCLEKVGADDGPEVFTVDVGCELLDPATGGCTDYPNRLSRDVQCFKLTPAHIRDLTWLPPSCAYQRVMLGKGLEWWHPLVSGDPTTVQKAGMSVAGRFIRPHLAGPREYHTVDWPTIDPAGGGPVTWHTALFGGVNASVPTPFGPDARIDLNLMAAHCFWLLENGCHGLAILDNTGEVASLAIAERIGVLEGLASRGVPTSKLITGIGPAAVADAVRIAATAERLGVRGLLLGASTAASASGKVMPHDVLPAWLPELLPHIGHGLHLHLSLSVGPSAVAACLTALGSLMSQAPNRLRGIRDESAGCVFGLEALEHFRDARLDVYTADDTMLAKLVGRGGAGVISAGANILGRLDAQILRAPEPTGQSQRTIESAIKAFRSRPVVPALKAIIARNTGRPDWSRVRPPLRPPGTQERADLFRAFDATGIRLAPAIRRDGGVG